MQKMRIVTHPGQAHRDDFLACALALAKYPEIIRIERREPTAAELNSPDVLVLDVGGQLDVPKNNFDHHQLLRDAAPACALSLLAEHLGLVEAFCETRWYESTTIMDSKGPDALAAHLGTTVPALRGNMSPIEGALLDLFGQQNIITPQDFLWGVLVAVGSSIVTHAEKLQARSAWLRANAQLDSVDDLPVMVVLDADNTGTQAFRDKFCPGVAVCISHDDRGVGWSLYRFNNDPRVDFSRLEGNPAVSFAHKGGFIAKTSQMLALDEVYDLVRLAMV